MKGRRPRARNNASRRKLRWHPSQFAGDSVVFQAQPGASEWVSFWAKYPASEFDPDALAQDEPSVEPSDETLVRTLNQATVGWEGAVPGFESPTTVAFGLIAFDGGQYPKNYDLGIFQEGVSLFAPPSPILEADDDWIIRLPFTFVADGQIQNLGDQLYIQSRAMRKLPPGRGVLAVIHPYTILAAASSPVTLTWMWDMRLLCKTGWTR